MFDYQRVPLNPLVNHNFPLSALPIEDLAPSPNKSIHINSYQVASASDILIWFPFYIKIYHIFHGFLQATNHHHRSPTLHHHHLLRTSSRRPVVPKGSLPDDPRAHPGAVSATSAHLRCPPVRCHRGSGAWLSLRGLGRGDLKNLLKLATTLVNSG